MTDDETAVVAAPEPAEDGGDVGVVCPQDFVSREPFRLTAARKSRSSRCAMKLTAT